MTDPANKQVIDALQVTSLDLLMSKGVYDQNVQIKENIIELEDKE